MTDELRRECEALPLKEQVELSEFLSGLISSSRVVVQSPLRCAVLMTAMAKAMGKDCVSYSRREADDVWARTMVAYQMCREGYPTTETGRQMMKDHSTIIHYRDKMRDVFALPKMYGDVLEIWCNFQKEIQQYDIHEGTTEGAVGVGGELPDGGQCPVGA